MARIEGERSQMAPGEEPAAAVRLRGARFLVVPVWMPAEAELPPPFVLDPRRGLRQLAPLPGLEPVYATPEVIVLERLP